MLVWRRWSNSWRIGKSRSGMSRQLTRLPGSEPPGFGSALRISKSPRWHSSMTRRCCRQIGATSNRSLGFGLKIGFTRRRRQQENTEPSAPADRLRPETFPTIQGRSWAAPAAEPEHSATSHANKRHGSRLLCSLSSPGELSAISESRAFDPPFATVHCRAYWWKRSLNSLSLASRLATDCSAACGIENHPLYSGFGNF